MAGDREKAVEVFSAKKLRVGSIFDKEGDGSSEITLENDTKFNGAINQYAGGANLVLSTGTGTKIATAANQKLSFWGVTPVIQFATTGETAGHSAVGGTNVNASDTFTGNFGTRAYTLNDIVKALKTCGIMDKDT